MKKPFRACPARKSVAKKTTGANPQSALPRRASVDWRDPLPPQEIGALSDHKTAANLLFEQATRRPVALC